MSEKCIICDNNAEDGGLLCGTCIVLLKGKTMSEKDLWDELEKELKPFGITGKEKSPKHHFDLSVTLTGFYWRKLNSAILAEREACAEIAEKPTHKVNGVNVQCGCGESIAQTIRKRGENE